MEGRFIIHAVLLVVSQSSFKVQTSFVDESEIQANFSIIQSGQETTLANFDTAFNGIFDIITRFAEARLGNEYKPGNFLCTSEAINQIVFDAFSEAHVATIAAISIVQLDTLVTVDWVADSFELEQVVNGIYDAILLSTNSSGTLAEIEEIEYKVTDDMVNIFQNLYASIGSGRNNQTDVIGAIDGAEAKALSIVRTAYGAIFSTIKILFKAYSEGIPTGREDVLSATKLARSLVSSVTKDKVRNKYALIEIIFIFSLVDDTEIPIDFSTIQASEKDILTGHKTAYELIFNIIYKLAENTDMSDEIEVTQPQVLSALIATFPAFVEGIQTIQMNKSSTITTDGNTVAAAMNQVVDGIFDAIVTSQSTNSSEKLAEIEVIEETVIFDVLSIYEGIYKVIVNISSTQDDVAAAIESVQVKATSLVEIAYRALFAAIKIIACTDYSSETPQARNESVSFAIEIAENVLFLKLNDEIALRFALLRNLYILNSLNNNGIVLDFPVSVTAC